MMCKKDALCGITCTLDGSICKKIFCPEYVDKPPTNADRFRAMTDDAMAQGLVDFAIASGWIHPNRKERARMMIAAYQRLTQPAQESNGIKSSS